MADVDSTNNGLLDTGAAIRPFLDLIEEDKSLNVSTVRSLAVKIFAHPDIFCGFDQFKAAAKSALQVDTAIPNTLDLFSYGTLKDYTLKQQQAADFYLPLNDSALSKLSQLTILSSIQSACFHGQMRVSYMALAESLGWITAGQPSQDDGWLRKVEDVLVQCVYANALKGRLCQKTRSFGWENESLPIVCSRDVPPEGIDQLLSSLKGLGQRLEASAKDVSQAQGRVVEGLTQADNLMNAIKEKQEAARTHHGKSGPGNASFPPFDLGRGTGNPNNRGAASRSARASNKRSRGGGSFANENAFRT